MSSHPKQLALERTLLALSHEVDEYLEDRYHDYFERHPNRPKRGTTASASHDGLFSIGTQFTPGYGSDLGRGYLVVIEIRTLQKVPPAIRQTIEEDGIEFLRTRLPLFFPDRKIEVKRDGSVYKMVGDFSLGDASH
ncbi:MAG: hypothetical protein GX911_06135 [Spirochaetales bacterium]|nr:hypothetical protein [Spirochaetales bacterium]